MKVVTCLKQGERLGLMLMALRQILCLAEIQSVLHSSGDHIGFGKDCERILELWAGKAIA